MSYAWRKLHVAVTELSGIGSQRQRLINAYAGLMCLRSRDLPTEIRADFESFMTGMVSSSLVNTEQAAQSKVNLLNDAEVSAMICSIIKMYDCATRYQPLIPADKSLRYAQS